MSLIALIAPSKRIAAVANKVREKYGLDMDIYVGLMENGADLAERLRNKGTKVFITRGGTAIMIRQKLHAHVSEIKMVLDDAIRAIEEAKRYGKYIKFIGFSNHLQGFDSLGPLLGLQIEQYVLKDWTETKTKVLEARDNGVDVIIGGAAQCAFAEEIGMPNVFLDSSETAIYLAYQDAKAMLDAVLVQERREEEIKRILDYSGDGFVAVDTNGNITLTNKFASKVFASFPDSNFIGQPISKVIPLISNLKEALNPDKRLSNDVISTGEYTLLYNRIPIEKKGEIIGAMATLKDIKSVQKDESSIRYRQYIKGLYAKYKFEDIQGNSHEICKVKQMAEKYAKTGSTILITSETGTGKEMFAQSIHNASLRKDGPFVAINCASLAESILESELFGYVEGAFTGARKSGKSGVFEMAKGGTIFLDEIGELPINLQGKLLRVLQERSVMRLGDDRIIPVDVRVIAATNRNLVQEIRNGKFREDLYFRLNILKLTIPPLRERKEDIPLLAKYLLEKHGANPSSLLKAGEKEALSQYNWPGNIRELENMMERIAVIGDSINIEELIQAHISEFTIEDNLEKKPLTPEMVEVALTVSKGNKTAAAKYLGVHRSTLWRYLENTKD
jgi:transcriptional regulator with PAS, ATPase and Fis domain